MALFKSAACLAVLALVVNVKGQHIHISAGAYTLSPGSPLVFYNGYLYDTNSYSGVYPACIYMNLNDPNVPLYPGLYQSDASFTALPGTIFTGGPHPFAAESGSYIELIVRTAQGPPGGELGFWKENDEFDATATTKIFSVPVGTLDGTNRFNLTQSPEEGGWPGDPFGHVHGRRFTVNKLGLYVIGVQLIDTSSVGVNGGPNHSPSEMNYFYFNAGMFINYYKRTNDSMVVRFALQGYKDYYLEKSTSLDGTNWITILREPGATHSDLHTLVDANATNVTTFYRIREVPLEF